MIYKDFLEENKLDIKQVTSILGYGKDSIYNNWKKDKEIPEIALRTLNYYIALEKKKEENIKLGRKIKMLSAQIKVEHKLSKQALEIAKKKCIDNDIKLEDYLSSLVLSNI